MKPARRLPNGSFTQDLEVYLVTWSKTIASVESFFSRYKVFAYDGSGMSLAHPECKHTLQLSMHAVQQLLLGDRK